MFLACCTGKLGKMQKALECLNEALPMERNANNQPAQAMTQNIMGRVYSDLGPEDKALALFNEALPVWRKLGIRQVEANTLTYMGRAYNDLGQREEALKDLNEALDDLAATSAMGRIRRGH
jgi:tetratricopeptide (TPR) repeat protein